MKYRCQYIPAKSLAIYKVNIYYYNICKQSLTNV